MSGQPAPYLFVKHSQNWNVDRCTRWMQANNRSIQWCYPADGDRFPEPDGFAGIVVFGGANSANDCTEHAWVKQELAFIERCLHNDASLFGICLGAQMMARVMGASIKPHHNALREVGFCQINPVAGEEQFLDKPLNIMQWHSEGFDLPSDTRCIAAGDDFPNQAYEVNDRVYGVQFHPEVNAEVLAIWHERNKRRPTGVLTEAERVSMMADAHRFEPQISAWLDGFLSRWTSNCERARL